MNVTIVRSSTLVLVITMNNHRERVLAVLERLKFSGELVYFPEEANNRTLIVIWTQNADINQTEALIQYLEQDFDFEKVDVACSLLNIYIQCW